MRVKKIKESQKNKEMVQESKKSVFLASSRRSVSLAPSPRALQVITGVKAEQIIENLANYIGFLRVYVPNADCISNLLLIYRRSSVDL